MADRSLRSFFISGNNGPELTVSNPEGSLVQLALGTLLEIGGNLLGGRSGLHRSYLRNLLLRSLHLIRSRGLLGLLRTRLDLVELGVVPSSGPITVSPSFHEHSSHPNQRGLGFLRVTVFGAEA